MQLTNTDNSNDIKQCTMVLPHEWINPLQLKILMETGSDGYYEEDGVDDNEEDNEEYLEDEGLNRFKVKFIVNPLDNTTTHLPYWISIRDF